MSYTDKLAPFDTPEVIYWGTVALAVYLSAFVIVTIAGFAFGYPDALWVWIVPFFAGFKWIFELVAKYGMSGGSRDDTSSEAGEQS